MLNQSELNVSFSYFFMYALIAYICGHAIQPVASLGVSGLQKLVGTNERKYATSKQDGSSPGLTAKVSKAHAEAVGMLSIALSLLILSIYFNKWSVSATVAMIYFVGAAIERSHARSRKIEDLL